MTLYWWMHWFWITFFNPYFLVTFLCWGSLVQSLSLPFVPVVENGHQNGPYITKLPSDTSSKVFNSKSKDRSNYHTANYQEIAHFTSSDLFTTDESIFKHLAKDELETPAPLLDENVSEHSSTLLTSDQPAFQPKTYLQFPFKISPSNQPKETVTQENKTFQLPNTNDNDDTLSSSLLRSPLIYDDPSAVSEQGSSTQSYQGIRNGKRQSTQSKIFGEQLMSDEPFNPTGSFINSTNIRSKLNTKPNSSTVKSTTAKSDLISMSEKPLTSHRSKTVNREKTIQERSQAAPVLQNNMSPILYVTPNSLNDSMENRPDSNEETNISVNNSDLSNATSILSDDATIVQNIDQWENRTDIAKSLASINDKMDPTPGVIPVSKERVGEVVEQEGLNAASVTGIAVGILSSAGLIGGISFIVYRRRYLNKPQTLNESNPDSIGYLDDSTLRENSEEMYSLDNDSFLNSLEAMTIQNYWTDSVKHTKL